MSTDGINRMLGEAVISDRFRTGLLNGQRAELVSDPRFQLEADETAALLSIQAEDLQQFAAAVERLIEQRKGAGAGGERNDGERAAAGLVRCSSLWTTGILLRPS